MWPKYQTRYLQYLKVVNADYNINAEVCIVHMYFIRLEPPLIEKVGTKQYLERD